MVISYKPFTGFLGPASIDIITICPVVPLYSTCVTTATFASLPQDICIDSFESQLCSIPKEGDEHCDTWNGGNMVKVMAAALVLAVVQTELQEGKSRQLTRGSLGHKRSRMIDTFKYKLHDNHDKTSYLYSHELRSTISMIVWAPLTATCGAKLRMALVLYAGAWPHHHVFGIFGL